VYARNPSNLCTTAFTLDLIRSMFADYRSGKRASNASARLLSVRHDMEPVVSYLLSKQVSKGDVMKVRALCLLTQMSNARCALVTQNAQCLGRMLGWQYQQCTLSRF